MQPAAKADEVRWIEVADATALREVAYGRILSAAARAIEQRGRFLLVLAGGDTPREVYRMLRTADTDWACWHIYYGDECCLPIDDTNRNSRTSNYDWLNHVPIPHQQLHPIPAELGPEAAAQAYSASLHGVGEFDLVLLGLGEDGHTASLFPGADWGLTASAADALAVLDAPPPPQRVSLSAHRLSRTREVLFLVEGESRRTALAQWQAGIVLPASVIRSKNGIDVLAEAVLLNKAP
jgi:6-phosphogluconolactonase